MAKKKIEPIPRGTAHVRLDLTEEQRDELRVLAAREGLSMAAFARALIVREIEKGKPPRRVP